MSDITLFNNITFYYKKDYVFYSGHFPKVIFKDYETHLSSLTTQQKVLKVRIVLSKKFERLSIFGPGEIGIPLMPTNMWRLGPRSRVTGIKCHSSITSQIN